MRPAEARDMFDRSAPTYDPINRWLSLGLDRGWRRWVASRAAQAPGESVLEAMSGSAEIGVAAALRGARVTVADISPTMLAHARARAREAGVEIESVHADITSQGALAGRCFDAVCLSFGLRYVEDPLALLDALSGHVQIAGRLVVLEFCVPRSGPIATPAAFYFFKVLPRLAVLLGGEPDLYRYLHDSVRRVGRAEELDALVEAAGLRIVQRRTFGFGLVWGVVAQRP